MQWSFALVALGFGCGRVGFSPLAGDATDATRSDGELVDPDLLLWLPFDDADPSAAIANLGAVTTAIKCHTTCPAPAAGRIGGSLAFTADAVRIADMQALHVSTGTVALWVQATALPAVDDYGVFAGTAYQLSEQNTWEVFHVSSATTTRIQGGGDAMGGLYIERPWTWGLGTWIHVAMTWDGTTQRLYVDGVELGANLQFTTLYDGRDLVVGGDEEGTIVSHYFAGQLDDLRLYRRALSAAEIMSLAAP